MKHIDNDKNIYVCIAYFYLQKKKWVYKSTAHILIIDIEINDISRYIL